MSKTLENKEAFWDGCNSVMPIFVANSRLRRILFRSFVIGTLCGVAFVFCLFLAEAFSPTNHSPLSLDIAHERYLYYYSSANRNKVAFTFDDGPTPADTQTIAEVLKRHEVPATFFFIGRAALTYPNVVRSVAQDGFAVGNHSFSHALSVHDSEHRFVLELHSTEVILERLTGTTPMYYRPPFLLGIGIDPAPNPYTPPAASNAWALAQGYMPVGIDIDSLDWAAQNSTEIVEKFKQGFVPGKHIALFHDTPYTAAAVEEIIPWVKEQGYEVVPLEELLEPPQVIALTQDLKQGDTPETVGEEVALLQWFLYKQGHLDPYAMSGTFDQETAEALVAFKLAENLVEPYALTASAFTLDDKTRERIHSITVAQTTPAPTLSSVFVLGKNKIEELGIYGLSYVGHAITLMAVLMISLIALRVTVLLSLLGYGRLRQKNSQKILSPAGNGPLVSVLIPAYNEEQNIHSTVESVIQNTYPNREIIVLDDGSTDHTTNIVRHVFSQHPKESTTLIRLENGGKARALNIGIERAHGEIVMVLDGDAALDPEAIGYMVSHFEDARVGAVAGKVKTAKEKSILAAFQALEYMMGQNIDKRAFSVTRAVGVVPGPAGAWRRQVLLELGGFPSDTLVEDQDMTLTILRAGYDVLFEPRAISYTETPHTIRNFLKQRFRWVYGTIQCFWKHKGVFVERPLSPVSLVVMPNTLLFSMLLPALYPIVDTVLVLGLFFGVSTSLLTGVVLFTIIDMLYALWGVWNEPGGKRLVFLIPLQRIFYRQLLYYTVIKSLVRAIEGRGAGWNKFKKVGQTQQYYLNNLASSASAKGEPVRS